MLLLLQHKQFDYQGSRAPDDYDSACPGYTRFGVSVVTTDTNMTQVRRQAGREGSGCLRPPACCFMPGG